MNLIFQISKVLKSHRICIWTKVVSVKSIDTCNVRWNHVFVKRGSFLGVFWGGRCETWLCDAWF